MSTQVEILIFDNKTDQLVMGLILTPEQAEALKPYCEADLELMGSHFLNENLSFFLETTIDD